METSNELQAKRKTSSARTVNVDIRLPRSDSGSLPYDLPDWQTLTSLDSLS